MTTKLASRIVGLSLLGLALWGYYIFTLGEFYRYSDEQHQAAPRVVFIGHSVFSPNRGASQRSNVCNRCFH